MAMHWGEEFLSGAAPHGQRAGRRQRADHAGLLPGLETARVQARRGQDPQGRDALAAAGAWPGCRQTMCWRRADRTARLMRAFAFASCVPFGRERSGVLFRAAAHEAPDLKLAAAHRSAARPERHRSALRYADKRGPAPRRARRARGWRHPRWKASCWPATPAPRPGSSRCCRTNCPPRPMAACCWCRAPRRRCAVASRGKQVCTCFNVTDTAIDATGQLQRQRRARLAALQDEPEMRHQLRLLRAGTPAHGAQRAGDAGNRLNPRALP